MESPEDFVVNEILEDKFTHKFSRSSHGVKKIEGRYTLYKIKKRNCTTHNALKMIADRFGIDINSIGYAGLKDKFAVAAQYITVKNPGLPDMKIDGVEIGKIGKTDKRISVGDLKGNEFIIKLHDCRNMDNIDKIMEEIRNRGLPNHFGLQRFGSNKDNHVIGRLIVKRRFGEALRIINKNNGKKYRRLNQLDKRLLKFFVHSYQSWIFNEVLNKYIGRNKNPFFSGAKILGCDTRLGKGKTDRIISSIMKRENIRQEDFRIDELRIKCRGGSRNGFIRLDNIQYKKISGSIVMRFMLPRGSYATVLLRELTKSLP